MNRTSTVIAVFMVLPWTTVFSSAAEKKSSSTPLAVPTPEQLAWQDLEYGMFCHFATLTYHDTQLGTGKEGRRNGFVVVKR